MNTYAYLLLLCTLWLKLASANQNRCPPASVLEPCSCDYEGVNCNSAKEASEIAKAFSSLPEKYRFRNLWIIGTHLTFLEKQSFCNVSFQTASIQFNDIARFETDIFFGSHLSMKSLIASNNRLTNIPSDSIVPLMVLESLDLRKNLIEEVKSEDFAPSLNVRTLDLNHNRIKSIGECAFAGLFKIEKLDLSNNLLTSLVDNSFYNLHENTLQLLALSNNRIERIGIQTFSRMAGGYGDISLAFNRLKSLDGLQPVVKKLETNENARILLMGNLIQCNENLTWILPFQESIKKRIFGISCNEKPIWKISKEDLLISAKN